MTQGGGGGFETGADFVAAKVSIDVPSEGIQSLKEISQGIDRFRTATEAAARGSASFIGYLNQMVQAGNMATEANRNLAAQLERTADTQQRMQTGGTGGAQQLAMSRGAPQGFVDNFAGMGIGMGSQRAPTTPAYSEMQQQIDATQGSDPRKYLSAQAGRSRLLPGELTTVAPGATDWGSHADRVGQRERQQRDQAAETGSIAPRGDDWGGQVSKYGGLAGNMMNEMAPGKGFGGMAAMAGAGLSALGRRASAAAPSGTGAAGEAAQEATSAESSKGGGILGMLAPLLKFAGPVGAAIGAGVGALGLVEKGGSMVQGWRNMGNIQGGGSSQGFADDMRIKAMALDPFLSTEQARSVVMAGLTEGYHGAQFDTVTKFIAPQPLSEPVLTPTGWRKMGELCVGDLVIGGDGRPRPILGVRDWGALEVFELTFQDGTTARSSGEHRWLTHCTTRKSGPKLKTVRDMLRGSTWRGEKTSLFTHVGAGSMQPRYRVPLCQPVQFDERPLELDPYLLGLLLGDGSFSCSIGNGAIKLACCIKEDEYSFALPEGVTVSRVDREFRDRYYSEYIFGCSQGIQQEHRRGRPVNPLKVILNELGLLGHVAQDKFVPHDYLYASVESRIALLQGLIDTDGCIAKTGHTSFASTAPQLVEDVVFLVRSLGGMASVSWKTPKPGHVWGSKLPIAQVGIVLPANIVPARLPRKTKRHQPHLATARRAAKGIVSIERVGVDQCRCISVSDNDGDGLYITANFTVTHNSNLKDMNLQVGDSVQLLRKNVNEGGESLGDLRKQLQGMKDDAKGSTMSLPDIQKGVAGASGALVSAGVGGKEATEIARGAGKMWDSEATRGLKGQGFNVVEHMAGNSAAGGAMMAFGGVKAPGLIPSEVIQYLSKHGGPSAVLDTIKKTLVGMVHTYFRGPATQKDSAEYLTAMGIFTQALSMMGIADLDQGQVTIMVDNILAGNDPLTDKKDTSPAAAAPTAPAVPSGGMGDGGGFHTSAGFTPTANAGPQPAAVTAGIAGQYGKQSIQLIDAKGNASPYTGSKAQQQGLSDGDLKWRRSGEQGGGLSLPQTAGGGGGGGQTNVTFAPAQITVRVDQKTGQVTVSPNVLQLSPNAQAVHSGVGGASMNNPPPGDGYGYNYTGAPAPMGTQARE